MRLDKELPNLYIALVHHPVVNKRGKTIGSAVTNMDIHDIARAARTFGVNKYFVVTPYEDQAELTRQIMAHWTHGAGGEVNPTRKDALNRVRLAESLEAACEQIEKDRDQPVIKVATSARAGKDAVSCGMVREKLKENASHVLIFGTAWGLTQDLIDQCDYTLEPIEGKGAYNHLSVRSAASIYLDRLING